jgi:hypothetical protein
MLDESENQNCMLYINKSQEQLCGCNPKERVNHVCVLTGETVHPSTGRVEPVRGCLNNPSRLVWTTLTSLTTPLAALRSRKETKKKVDLS